MVVSGLLTYGFLVLAARTLGPDAYGQIGVLWGAIFIMAIVLFRPLEQTTSRAVADRLARGDEVRTVLTSVGLICAVMAVGGVVVTALGWGLITNRLFRGSGVMSMLLIAGVAVYGLAYLVRGLLGGVRWFEGYGLGLIADSVARLLVASPLFFVASKVTAAAALVAAGLAGAVVPLWVGRHRLVPLLRGGEGVPFRPRTALAFASPAGLIAASDQLLVNGSPLLVIAAGGDGASKAAGVVFAATMLVRAPVYVFQGLAASLLPNLTHLNATADRARLHSSVGRAVALLLAVGSLFVAGTAIVGPRAMEVIYGASFHADRVPLVLLAAGVACYLAASTLSQALLSLDLVSRAAAAWAASATAFVAVYALVPGSQLGRIGVSLVVACGMSLVLLWTMFRSARE